MNAAKRVFTNILLARIGADTAENERNFAEILPKIGNYPTGRGRPSAAASTRAAWVSASQTRPGPQNASLP